MTVLVTGGAGFIGSHLTRALLARGERVVCLDNFNAFYAPERKRRNVAPFLSDPAFTLVEGDIRSVEAVDGVFERYRPNTVAHLAALPGVRPSVIDPVSYQQVNVGGTVNLLQAAARTGVEVFLLASSSTVYGATTRVPFREDDPANCPLVPYAATKRAAELLAYSFHHLHGLPVIVTRFFNAYGPAVRPDLAASIFVRAVAEGDPITLRGNARRDFTYIDDTVAGVLAALTWRGGFEIVNLGNAHPVSMIDFIATIERVVGRPARIDQQPALPTDAPITYADLTKAERLLGYWPATTLADGLARLYAWYRQERQESGAGFA
ncbi:MAG: GDP-mannose 4,6-dehydratase [Chloroflexi bacterium]|nr:GDP-mannose 4,6-dehydratase [Chloroflexota bacterium]